MPSATSEVRSTIPRKDKARLLEYLSNEENFNSIPKMNDGKPKCFGLRIFLPLILLCIINFSKGGNTNPTVLRGGLVYSMENKAGLVYVNQASYQVTRTLATDSLTNGLQATYDTWYQYQDHCKHVESFASTLPQAQRRNPDPAMKQPEAVPAILDGYILQISKEKMKLIDAPHFCQKQGGRLPEVRGEVNRERLRSFMALNKIYIAYSSIQFNERGQSYHFLSDDKAANADNYILRNIHYGGVYNTYEYLSNMYNDNDKAQALKFPLLFTDPWKNFRLNVATWNQQNEWWPIVCEMPVNPNNGSRAIDPEERKTMMVTLARHACLRDIKMIEDKVKGQHADIEALMKIKIPIEPVNTVLTKLTPEGFYDWDVKRTKRGILENNITSQTMDLVQKIHN